MEQGAMPDAVTVIAVGRVHCRTQKRTAYINVIKVSPDFSKPEMAQTMDSCEAKDVRV